jgi:hypothetical protein
VLAVAAVAASAGGGASGTDAHTTQTGIEIPQSIQVEHGAIHSTLVEATQAAGPVGAAALELAEVLHPHFVREEEIALPPLALLAQLAARGPIPAAQLAAVRALSDTLAAELPRMLAEHKQIRAAVEKLRAVAQAEQMPKYVRLAEELALHAQTEEEVLYPTAVLVGEIIRARQQDERR